MSSIKIGHFLGDGGDVYLPIGFVPDYLRMCDIDSTTTNAAVCIHEWFERQEDDEATGSQEGWALGLATLGYTTLHADGLGIVAYDTGSQAPTIGVWTASTAYTARSATADGSFVKGTTSGTDNLGQAVDREAIFECVTAGTSGTTEPTWPTAIGDNSALDGTTAIWQRVNEPLRRGGYQGVKIDETIQTNTHEYYYIAIKADDSIDHGDVDGWTGGIDQNWV